MRWQLIGLVVAFAASAVGGAATARATDKRAKAVSAR